MLKWFDFFFKSTTYLYLHTLISTQERHFMQMWKLRIPFLYFQSIISCTSKVNLFFEYVEFSCHFSSLLSTCSYMEHAAIALYFRNFCTRSWCWCAISVSKIWEGKNALAPSYRPQLNITIYRLYFLFFQKHGQISGLPWLFFFELILIYSKYSYYFYIPIPKINRLYLEFKALTHSSNCK